jgi:hypothetical protein
VQPPSRKKPANPAIRDLRQLARRVRLCRAIALRMPARFE